jgi:hypothetical protein
MENIAGFLDLFITACNKDFFVNYSTASAEHQQILKKLVSELSIGITATPRIKNMQIKNFKIVKSKFDNLD